jgi:transposase
MRPFGTSKQLSERRQRAFGLLQQGLGPTQVAKQIGVTPQSVCRWRRESLHPKRKRSRPQGRPRRLSPAQLGRLVAALKRGAFAWGYAADYWTLDRIVHLIWHLFRVRYRSSSVWYVLQRLGWSSQKPQRRGLAHDEKAIAHWKRYVWPHIKKLP